MEVTSEEVELLSQAAEEIESLRRQNAMLAAKVQVMDIFAAALGFKQGEQGYGIDIVPAIRKRVDELVKEEMLRAEQIKRAPRDEPLRARD